MKSQNMSDVSDGEELPGKALKERWYLSLLLRTGRVEMEMDERWHMAFYSIGLQIYEATYENDLDFAIGLDGKKLI